MNNLSKIVVSSSLVLGAALFSLGCGDDACCKGNEVVAKVNLLSSNNLINGDTLLPNDHTLSVNGFGSSSDGTITKAVWTVYESCSQKNTILDTQTVTSKDTAVELDLATPGTHNVCVVVTDDNGNKDEDCTCVTVQQLDGPSASITGLSQTLKVGCPLPTPTGASSTTNSGSSTLTYAWTLDGNPAGSAVTPNLPTTLTAAPDPHEVCLTVTDSNEISNEQCQNVDIIPHTAPTAVLSVWNSGDTNQTLLNENTDALSRSDSYDLSCGGSHDDCPQDAEDLTCNWEARSYFVEGTDCSTTPQTNYISDCFTNEGGHSGFGSKVTDVSTPTFVQLCSANETQYKCVEVSLTVTDNLHNITSETVTKTFGVSP